MNPQKKPLAFQAIQVQDIDTLTVTETFDPQSYVDTLQAEIDQRNANIINYQMYIDDEQSGIDTAQSKIDAVTQILPALAVDVSASDVISVIELG